MPTLVRFIFRAAAGTAPSTTQVYDPNQYWQTASYGSSGGCKHADNSPHAKGEWIGAEIKLQTPLLAQYAVSHYLEQDRVLDADVID